MKLKSQVYVMIYSRKLPRELRESWLMWLNFRTSIVQACTEIHIVVALSVGQCFVTNRFDMCDHLLTGFIYPLLFRM